MASESMCSSGGADILGLQGTERRINTVKIKKDITLLEEDLQTGIALS